MGFRDLGFCSVNVVFLSLKASDAKIQSDGGTLLIIGGGYDSGKPLNDYNESGKPLNNYNDSRKEASHSLNQHPTQVSEESAQ